MSLGWPTFFIMEMDLVKGVWVVSMQGALYVFDWLFMFLNNTQRKSLKLSEATVVQFEAVESPEEKCVESSHESPDDEDSVSINRFL